MKSDKNNRRGEKENVTEKSHGWYKHKDFILLDLYAYFYVYICVLYSKSHLY